MSTSKGLVVVVLALAALSCNGPAALEAPEVQLAGYVLDPRVSVVGCREVEFFALNSVSSEDCAILEYRVVWFAVDQPTRTYSDMRFRRITENRITRPARWWVPDRFLIPVAIPVEHPGHEGAAK